MSIQHHVLGDAGRDNALLLYVCSGQSIDRLLFDCGDAVLARLSFGEIQRIDHLFFSHLHMDHVGGFDSFFRTQYDRERKPNNIWGPPETARIMHHRFQGFMWNLYAEKHATWHAHDIGPDAIATTRFELQEAFANAYPEGSRPYDGTILSTEHYTVEAVLLHHLTPSVGYIVRETPRRNTSADLIAAMGLQPGPWLRYLKADDAPEELKLDGVTYPIDLLRERLLAERPGMCVAYLTDFLLDAEAEARILPRLQGCDILVCESAYRAAEADLAERNCHLTAPQAAALAAKAGVRELILIHVTDRYPREEWPAILAEAQAVFPNTRFPRHWDVT